MSEPITFTFESFRGDTTYYDVYETGMVSRSDRGDEKIRFVWGNVKYIDDRARGWIYIILNNQREIPIKYTTKEFPVFLKTVCLRLSDIRKEDFQEQTFRLTPSYLLQLRVVVSILVLALIISLPLSTVLFFVLLSLSIPLAIFFQRQPISLTLDDQSLTVQYLHKKTTVDYPDLLDADFEVTENDYGSTLGIVLNLRNRKGITIRKLEDIIVFFIMLQIKLNEHSSVH